jgi:hypothetical protein
VAPQSQDLTDYLKTHGAAGYPVDDVRHCACHTCGANVFEVHGVIGEPAAKRVCTSCGDHRYIADSERYWNPRNEYVAVCTCDEQAFTMAVGFSLYKPGTDGIRAVATAERCVACGAIDSLAEWMLRTADLGLLDRA